MIHILYHANCADGFASACIAFHALLRSPSLPVSESPSLLKLHPVGYDTPMPITSTMAVLDRLIFVDFTPPEAWLSEMTDLIDPASCTIIDHHKTKADVHQAHGGRLFESIFATTQSGAMLTWKHFFPSVSTPPPMPLLLLQHYDLGGVWDDPRHPLTNEARWLVAYLMRCLPRTPEAWTPVLLHYGQDGPRVIDLGARMYSADQRLIRSLVKAPHWVNIGGFEVPALNGIPYGLLNDALAELLIEHPDIHFAAAWSVLTEADAGGVIKWSLRSRKNGFDCAALCQTLAPNGGGHPSAAGFSTLDPVQFI